MFNTSAGEIVERHGHAFILTSRGYDGNAVYGPYNLIAPGRYVVTFEVESAGAADIDDTVICARVDVASRYGTILHAFRDVSWGEIKSRSAIIPLQFDLFREETLEFRIYSTGEVSLLLSDSNDIFRTSDAPESFRPSAGNLGFPDVSALPMPTRFVQNARELKRLYERGVSYQIREDGFSMEYQGRVVQDASQDDINRSGDFFPLGSRIDVSYAQMREDVILANALIDVSRDEGFYIDVGANDPNFETVTKLFYDRGWHGINIEPSPEWSAKLTAARPRDINIQAAVSDRSGEVTFYDIDGGQLGTLHQEFAQRHVESGMDRQSYTVPCLTLSEICSQYASKDIHFLKIDVEGFEGEVIRGMNFKDYRPWILVVEATEPLRVHMLTHHEWEPLLVQAGYLFALRDGVNRYYVASERSYLLPRFDSAPTGYVTAAAI